MFSAMLLVASSGAAIAQDDAFDLKGVRLGATEAEIRAKLPAAFCQDNKGPSGERTCLVMDDSYGGVKASFFYFLRTGKVSSAHATFAARDFDVVVQAMKVRYGKPNEEQAATVQNRMGATFDNNVIVWTRGGERLTAERRYASIDKSGVVLRSDADIKAYEESSRKDSKKRAGDL